MGCVTWTAHGSSCATSAASTNVTWAGTEYVEHCVDGTDQTLAICDRAVARADSPRPTSISEAAVATEELIADLSDSQWDVVTDGWSIPVTVRGALVHLLHDLEHH